MKISILARSSSGEPYAVDFDDSTGAMRVFCRCQAGIRQLACKHKIGLLLFNVQTLHHPDDAAHFELIKSSPAYPAIRQATERFVEELDGIEREQAVLKKRERSLKDAFSHLLHHAK